MQMVLPKNQQMVPSIPIGRIANHEQRITVLEKDTAVVTPGNNKDIIYNNNGVLGANSKFKFDSAVPGFGYSANTIRGLLDLYNTTIIGTPSPGTITQIDDGFSNIQFFGNFFNFDVYAYRTIGSKKIYSVTPLNLQITDNADASQGYLQLSWSAVSGASGYFISCVEDDWLGFGGQGLDVGNVLTSNFGNGTESAYGALPTFNSAYGPDVYMDASGNLISQNAGTFSNVDSPLFEPTGGTITFHTKAGNKVNFKMDPSSNSMIRFGKDADGSTTQRMFQFTDTGDTVEYFIFAIDPTGQPMISTQSKTHFYIGNAPSGIPIVKFDFDTSNGRLGIGQTPTAALHLKAGSTSAGSAPLKLTSGSVMTSPEAGAIEFNNDLIYATRTTGPTRQVLNAYTSGRLTAKTSAQATVASFTPTVDGSFLISANVLVTTATLHNFTVTCSYTDEGNTARTITLTFSNVGGTLLTAIANAGGAVPYEGIPLHIRAKANTAITIATTGTFTTVTYNVEGAITQIA